jgi:hypothetical protein
MTQRTRMDGARGEDMAKSGFHRSLSFLKKCGKLASATRSWQVGKLAEVSFPAGRRSGWTKEIKPALFDNSGSGID